MEASCRQKGVRGLPQGCHQMCPIPKHCGFRTFKGTERAPHLDHNPQRVTDITVSPHPPLQQGTVEETEAAGTCHRGTMCPCLASA